jgi:hypothetical protein
MPAGLGFQAQDGVARVAGDNRKGDFRAVADPDQGSDVLGGIDSHFHVDVKETKADRPFKEASTGRDAEPRSRKTMLLLVVAGQLIKHTKPGYYWTSTRSPHGLRTVSRRRE